MNPVFGAEAVRRGEQPPLDSALRRSVRIAAAKADTARVHPFPTTHHEQDHHMTAAAVDPTVRAEQTTERQIQNRTLEMQLLHESLARAHMQERLQEAEHQRLVVRVARAHRLKQKAERASMRARKALAVALM
ncbi:MULTISPECIES: hypothetical protein [unclassified Streptomyces]|uniref:hypothetical protein n=2 Tax=Kitasatosporales TaxID=85011 RepID=UPI002E76C2AC|nr:MULTISPECIES: hypothetical protein [unclassified Streptomyces]MED7950044.1 hypothetical protein [Streptomyces sp. BE303]MEE1826970.1 hypothetical protein [Streptomyces sp. BE20]